MKAKMLTFFQFLQLGEDLQGTLNEISDFNTNLKILQESNLHKNLRYISTASD